MLPVTGSDDPPGGFLFPEWVAFFTGIRKEPQKAYSGRVMFRVSPEMHGKAAVAAELSGKSLNQWAEEVLERAAAEG